MLVNGFVDRYLLIMVVGIQLVMVSIFWADLSVAVLFIGFYSAIVVMIFTDNVV
jgi:hypothetical protein